MKASPSEHVLAGGGAGAMGSGGGDGDGDGAVYGGGQIVGMSIWGKLAQRPSFGR